MDIVTLLFESNIIKKISHVDWSEKYGFTDIHSGSVDDSLTDYSLIDLIGELSNNEFDSPKLDRFNKDIKVKTAVKIIIEITDETLANKLLELLSTYTVTVATLNSNNNSSSSCPNIGFKYICNQRRSINIKPEFVEEKKQLELINIQIEDIKTSIEQKLQLLALSYGNFYIPRITNDNPHALQYQNEGKIMFQKSLEPYVSRYSMDFEESNNTSFDDLLKSKLSLGTKFQIHTPSFWYGEHKTYCINIFISENIPLYDMLKDATLIMTNV